MKRKILSLISVIKNKLSVTKRPLLYLIGFIVFVSIQILFSPIGLKIDLSEGKAYSLSLSTKKILAKLEKPLSLKLYISSNLPSRLIPIRSDVVDLLNEYRKEGNSKITISTVDPKKDEKILAETKEIGIQELQFSQLEKDKYQVTTAFLGLGIFYDDKKMSIPQLTDLSNLEYNLSSVILKLTKKETAKVGVIGNSQLTGSQTDPYSIIGSLLFKEYEVSPIDLSAVTDKGIDKSYKSVVLSDNRNIKYSDKEVAQINTYLNQGGKLLIFADGVWVQDSLNAIPADHNLFSLLNNWGVKLEKNLVLSSSAELINFGNENQQFIDLYYFWFRTNNFISKTTPLSNIESVTFPWGSSVSLSEKKDISSQILIQSSPQSWIQKDTFKLNPQEIPQPNQKDLKTYPLVAHLKNKKNGELIFIPSSRFVEDKFLTRDGGNVEFVFNIMDNFTSGGALSGIRSRSVSFHPLPVIGENQRDIFKYSMMFLLPSLFGIYGAWRLTKRG